MKKLVILAMAVFILLTTMLGCSAMPYTSESAPMAPADDYYAKGEYAAAEEAGYDMAYPQEEPAAESNDGGASAGSGADINYDSLLQPGVNRKIIYNGNISIQTTRYDEDYKQITDTLLELGGYAESNSESGNRPQQWNDPGRTANLTLRVPSKHFGTFIEKLKGFGETMSIDTYGQDISTQYFDTQTRLKTLRTREERLIALLEEAKGLEDIIKLEQELANVAYEIQMHEINLRNYDSLVDFSTINIYLREVNEVERVTSDKKDLGSRISSGFYSVLNVLAEIGEGLLIFLVAGLPVFVPLALILFLVLGLVRRSRKKKAQKSDAGK